VFAVSLSVFAALRPYLLKQTVDGYIQTQDAEGLLYYITLMGIVLLCEVFSQFYFVFWANWLGQDIVKTFESNCSNIY
jgi:ABC-type multidrug transport system fused ATPase/permease subunit